MCYIVPLDYNILELRKGKMPEAKEIRIHEIRVGDDTLKFLAASINLTFAVLKDDHLKIGLWLSYLESMNSNVKIMANVMADLTREIQPKRLG